MQARIESLLPDNGSGDEVELDERIFGVEVRPDILQRVVQWQLAKRRAGSHNTKTRSEVSYSKRKVVRQKRTGSARHGARSAGIFRHGGVSHGPKPRSHATDLPKRIRRLGLCMALSAKAKSGNLIVLENLELSDGRSRLLRDSVVAPGTQGTLVIGGAEIDGNFARAARNFRGLDVLPSIGANVYDILRCGRLALTREAVADLEARLQ